MPQMAMGRIAQRGQPTNPVAVACETATKEPAFVALVFWA